MLQKGRAVLLQTVTEPEITEGEPQEMHCRAGKPDGGEVLAKKCPRAFVPRGLGRLRLRLPVAIGDDNVGRSLDIGRVDHDRGLHHIGRRSFHPGRGGHFRLRRLHGQFQPGNRQGHRHDQTQQHQQPQIIKHRFGQFLFENPAQKGQCGGQRRSADGERKDDLHQIGHVSPPFGT